MYYVINGEKILVLGVENFIIFKDFLLKISYN